MTQAELDALMAGDVDLEEIPEKEAKLNEIQDKADSHEHKHYNDTELVSQLGEVTSESEEKGIEVFNKLDEVLEKLDLAEKEGENTAEHINDIRNTVFEIMSIMQYQDIHRQKIERVINTMRSISQIMSSSLDSVSGTFAPSAKHIPGDKDTEDLVDDDELARLVAEMGNNN